VTKVEEFSRKFVKIRRIRGLRDIAKAEINDVGSVWINRKFWKITKEVTFYLSTISEDSKTALGT